MKTKWLISIAAIALVISTIAVKPAVAYFTDTITAEGEFPITIGDGEPVITETVENMTKKITIKNTGDYDIFVRVKVIKPDSCTITPEYTSDWTEDGEYYYYNKQLKNGETTAADSLAFKITRSADATGDFNVIIIQEATKAIYGEDGKVDWSTAISTSTSYSRNR